MFSSCEYLREKLWIVGWAVGGNSYKTHKEGKTDLEITNNEKYQKNLWLELDSNVGLQVPIPVWSYVYLLHFPGIKFKL